MMRMGGLIRYGAVPMLLALASCAAPLPGPTQPVFGIPRSDQAAADVLGQAALADAVESVDQLLDSGRAAYQASPAKRSALDYCRSGEAAIERGALRAAVRDKSMALFAARQNQDFLLSAECARSIAVAYSFAGLHRRATDWATEAETYLKQAGAGADPARIAGVRGPILKVQADAALGRGDRAQARALLGSARTIAPDYFRPYILVSLAQIDLAQGALPEADADLDAANDLAGVSDDLNAIIVRSKGEVALARKDLPSAAALFGLGITLSAQSADTYARAWAERGLARTYLGQGRLAEASAAYSRAILAAEQSRAVFRAEELRSGAFGTLQVIFDEAVDAAAQQGRWAEAFDLSERGRARSLRELLRGQDDAHASRVATAQQVQAGLPAGTALVSYHILGDRLLIWTIRRSGVRGTSVATSGHELGASVRRFTGLISRPGQDAALGRVAQELSSILIGPAGIAPGETIVFEPYGILHNLAFAALKDGSRFLIEDHVISEVLTADAVIGAAAVQVTREGGIAIFSNPDGTLPGADAEAAVIAQLFPGAALFSGRQATRDRFIAEGNRAHVLHLATHAIFDPLDPLASRIRLAGRSAAVPDDLQVQDVLGLQLGTVDLLALSACETSIGFPSPGDEVIGFNRAFAATGVRNLVSTLWSINDQATALLMSGFYKNLSGARGASMPEALRRAQLELLRLPVTASPYYWAAFTLTQSAGHASP